MKNPIRAVHVATIVIVPLLASLSGCLSRKLEAGDQYACDYMKATDPLTGDLFDPETMIRPSPKPIIKRVEFTDDGEVVDRCQWSDALFEVKGLPSNEQRKPKLVVLYIHGWKHDGAPKDEDLSQFTQLILELDRVESARKTRRDVVGIFVSWPGKALNVPVLDNLSFWSRKGGADRVSAAGNVTKFISSVSNVSRQRGSEEDFIVGIGHSFGGRILYSSVSPVLLHAMAMSHPGERFGTYGEFRGNVDLTVLLNPAFEASRYTAIDASRRFQEKFSDDQRPLLLSVSTENDSATKLAFPLGQIIGTRWRERERTTLGNYEPYRTHHLSHADNLPSSSGIWYDSFCESGLCLVRDDPIKGYPFLVAKTDASVLDGHNGIWSPSFRKWLADFIEITSDKRMIGNRPEKSTNRSLR
ncbi:hypothetical protein [Pseudomonas fluorescens]|uniref:Alpha/beta hydrolase n=1 Tax=Pseudomonas fluorescens TaxID=294 RepID=A0A5E7VLQ6_PSEFL|nr:hypothetical protein [Pseudomonas fluorescens]VVQ23678.1 hypothetical protein PS928_05584 [Pseudomonas fluorescens]